MVDRMIFGSRLAVVVCLMSYGCWLSYIPWKVDLLGIEYDMFGFALLVFGIFSLSSMLFVSHVLLPRFGPRIAGLAVVGFAFALQLWVFAPNTTLFIALAAPFSLAFGGDPASDTGRYHTGRSAFWAASAAASLGIFFGRFAVWVADRPSQPSAKSAPCVCLWRSVCSDHLRWALYLHAALRHGHV